MIEIRKCLNKDIKKLTLFINNHWKQNHALVVSQELLDWQHKSSNNSYNFIIALEKNEIIGILGYINNNRFEKREDSTVIWLALWKIKDGSKVQGLGIKLLNKLNEIEKPKFIGVNGINKIHPPMYRALKYKNVELECFFIVNPQIQHELILNQSSINLSIPKKNESNIFEMKISDLQNLNNFVQSPFIENSKSPEYFIKRFLLHPIYKYRVFLLKGTKHNIALLSTRLVKHNNSKVLKIVDFAGDFLSLKYLGYPIFKKIIEEQIEYVDFWQSGIKEELFLKSGFNKLDKKSSIIVPNYFEPYVHENTTILSAYKSDSNNVCIFRADGDQDRPNLVQG